MVLEGVNAAPELAHELTDLLVPFNKAGSKTWKTSVVSTVRAFQHQIWRHRLRTVFVQQTKGEYARHFIHLVQLEHVLVHEPLSG